MPPRRRDEPDRQFRRLLLRASALFLTLFAAEAGILGWLMIHHFEQRVLRTQLQRARVVGDELAAELIIELAPQGAIDQLRIAQRKQVIARLIESAIARLGVVDFIEVRTPDARPVLRLNRGAGSLLIAGSSFGGAAPPNPDSPSEPAAPWGAGPPRPGSGFASDMLVERPLAGDAGTLLLGVEPTALRREAERLWGDMVLKLLFGGLFTALLLGVAFLYVLRMIHRTRRLEAETQRGEQLAQLGTLASGLAHEIRNPLNAMSINMQMLEEELESGRSVGDESLALLRSSRAEVLRLERLVKDFLAFARPDAAEWVEAMPGELVSDVTRFVRPEFTAAGVLLELVKDRDTPPIWIDPGQIRQALLNVLQNALDVSERGQTVRVRVQGTPLGEASIEISDEGPGISDALKEQIFEVFWSKKPAGSGLGLPIARRAVERHGGRIELESVDGAGSTFRIVLPPAVAEGRERSVAARYAAGTAGSAGEAG